ncbi:MAG: GNAT family N-acetyltransferase [Nanoarchaeota archaeon]|nr:GNAT family N-acetyltransferase [Nanoarchaeota archaeon]MBU4116337.1 GNAT family N-acetyltransferase [Nanoarchaeota archaeon]
MRRILKKQVKWRKDKKALFICDCKRLIDLKLSFEHEAFLKKLFQGLNPNKLVGKENLIFLEFEKMNFLDDLKINQLPKEDFYLAMSILDNELGKNRTRDSNFLKEKFKENTEFFIGIYLGEELIGVVCGFPREDYLLMSEIAIDSKFQRRKFGEKLVEEFEKVAFKKYNKIHVGALDNAIEFYKSLNYKPFLLVQFANGVYNKNDFSNFEVLRIRDYGIELNPSNCNLIELKRLSKLYPKAKLQYIFTKNK